MLLQEEALWMQKFRTDWVRLGDGKTKFFHTSTLIWRRRNRIDELWDENGQWISDAEKLKDMEIKYYKDLFSSIIHT